MTKEETLKILALLDTAYRGCPIYERGYNRICSVAGTDY